MKSKVRWGVIGCAGIARKQFLPALQQVKQGKLYAIGSSDHSKAKEWKEIWGAKKAYGSYEEVIADPEVDAVYIPLPNHLHAEWTIKALRAKKHVLCEKPMAITVEECEQMLRVAEEEQRVYMEGFMYRFHPQIDQALAWISSGEIGDVKLVRGSFSFRLTDQTNVRLTTLPGGGSLWDVGCYPIHFSNLIFGGPPIKVATQGDFQQGTQVDLSMTGLLNYGAGRQGIFDCGFNRDNSSFMEIVGERGTISLPVPWRPDSQEVTIVLRKGNEELVTTFPINNPYQLEIEHFQDCIQTGGQPLLPGSLGRDVVAVIQACYISALRGVETPVQIEN